MREGAAEAEADCPPVLEAAAGQRAAIAAAWLTRRGCQSWRGWSIRRPAAPAPRSTPFLRRTAASVGRSAQSSFTLNLYNYNLSPSIANSIDLNLMLALITSSTNLVRHKVIDSNWYGVTAYAEGSRRALLRQGPQTRRGQLRQDLPSRGVKDWEGAGLQDD